MRQIIFWLIIIVVRYYPYITLLNVSSQLKDTIKIRITTIIAMILLFFFLWWTTHAEDKYDHERYAAQETVSLINKYRVGNKLPALQLDQYNYELAQVYARELCQDPELRTTNTSTPYISHVRADWATLRTRANEINRKRFARKTLWENLAAGKLTPKQTLQWRHDSKTHRQVMQWTGRTGIGVGVCETASGNFYVSIFSN